MFRRAITLGLVAASCIVAAVHGATFGFAENSAKTRWTITTGAGLVVTMTKSTCDITSLLYNGKEMQYKSAQTQVNSGLGSVTSSITSFTDSKQSIQVTCSKTGLTQYYFFRANENAIYMGTYHSNDLVLPELRFLARLDRSAVSSGVAEAVVTGMTAIEAEDVVKTSNGQTRSKFYSAIPFMSDHIHGAYGSAGGIYFVMSDYAYETSSSGPFFRDINNKIDVANELTFYMNSDHTRTEDYRYGFHGPYALVFTAKDAPTSTSVVDFSFFQKRSLTGFVTSANRGQVKGTITDTNKILSGSAVVVHWSNSAAQYWVNASSSLTYTSPLMKPGTYTVTVYKKELPVSTSSVTVTKAATVTSNIAVTYSISSSPIWRIGEWDGTPDGFLNADKIHTMHPSDVRMSAWKSMTFTVGTTTSAQFPMAQFRSVNDPINIAFTLTEAQAASTRKLRIGVPLSQMSARPAVTVNSKWNGPTLASSYVKTRGVTRGVTHGNYFIYEYTIPATALITGSNTIKLSIASGSTDQSATFLHAAVVFDALELL